MMIFPEIDERSEQDLLDDFFAKIARYVPGWDPKKQDLGMALAYCVIYMQMEMIVRLNQVPKVHYIHFLNFIGEYLRPSQPSVVLLTFTNRIDAPQLVKARSICTTKQTKEIKAINTSVIVPSESTIVRS